MEPIIDFFVDMIGIEAMHGAALNRLSFAAERAARGEQHRQAADPVEKH